MQTMLVIGIFDNGRLTLTNDDYDSDFDLVFTNGTCRSDDPLWEKHLIFLSRISEIVNKQGGIEKE